MRAKNSTMYIKNIITEFDPDCAKYVFLNYFVKYLELESVKYM